MAIVEASDGGQVEVKVLRVSGQRLHNSDYLSHTSLAQDFEQQCQYVEVIGTVLDERSLKMIGYVNMGDDVGKCAFSFSFVCGTVCGTTVRIFIHSVLHYRHGPFRPSSADLARSEVLKSVLAGCVLRHLVPWFVFNSLRLHTRPDLVLHSSA